MKQKENIRIELHKQLEIASVLDVNASPTSLDCETEMELMETSENSPAMEIDHDVTPSEQSPPTVLVAEPLFTELPVAEEEPVEIIKNMNSNQPENAAQPPLESDILTVPVPIKRSSPWLGNNF